MDFHFAMTDPAHLAASAPVLAGQRVAVLGRLAGMSKRDAQQLVRDHGGLPLERPDATATLLVVGENEPLTALSLAESLEEPVRQAAEQGRLEVIRETELWRRLGLIDQQAYVQNLYTPAMLAELVGVEIAVIRRWQRLGLIVPVREVRRLPYFDFQEVSTARHLAELLASGMSVQALRRKLAALARWLPAAQRPLAQLTAMVEGSELLLRKGAGLIDAAGQFRFDFEAIEQETAGETSQEESVLHISSDEDLPTQQSPLATDVPGLLRAALDCEDAGDLAGAIEMCRTAAAAGGTSADLCFRMAELLYRAGDLPAARERYYMAVELDEDLVEARANLGCVLAEMGQLDLAVAAFEGALVYHEGYADVHYHLARTLDELGRGEEAQEHWRRFLELAPQSPWAEEARDRLA